MSKPTDILQVIIDSQRSTGVEYKNRIQEEAVQTATLRCAGTTKAGTPCKRDVITFVGEVPLCPKHEDLTDSQQKKLASIRRDYDEQERRLLRNLK